MTLPITIRHDVPVVMPDGLALATDVWTPAALAPRPTLLQRTPYDKSASLVSMYQARMEPLRAVAAGFNVVIQDVRGRGASPGDFEPFIREEADGATTIAWIRSQDWSDGRILTYGPSYVGAAQLLAAAGNPPGLAGVAPHLTSGDYWEGWIYQAGAFQLGFALWWTASVLAPQTLLRLGRAGQDVTGLAEDLSALLADPAAAYERLPLDGHRVLDALAPWYRTWLEHPARDRFWASTAVTGRLSGLDLPGLHFAGWNDIFAAGSLRAYEALAAGPAPQRLIVGPWAHGNTTGYIGDATYGELADQAALDLPGEHLDWAARVAGETATAPGGARLFLMGANTWREVERWPPLAVPTRLHLRAAGPGTSSGGLLSAVPALGDEPADTFAYLPGDPVPTTGGPTFLPALQVGRNAGPRYQAAVERRADVLTYTSEVLTEPLEVIGWVAAELWVCSSAPDCDWTARLCDVDPAGRSLGIVDGITRVRFRDDPLGRSAVPPGTVALVRVDLGPTAMIFQAGHRLRVQVSGSNFPRFDRHLCGHQGPAPGAPGAVQRVFHTSLRPSRITLPVTAGRFA